MSKPQALTMSSVYFNHQMNKEVSLSRKVSRCALFLLLLSNRPVATVSSSADGILSRGHLPPPPPHSGEHSKDLNQLPNSTPSALQVSGGSKVKKMPDRRRMQRNPAFTSPKPMDSFAVPRTESAHVPSTMSRPYLPQHFEPAEIIGTPQAPPALTKDEVGLEVLSSQSSSAQDKLSFAAVCFMAVLALQFGVQPLLVKRYTPKGINRSTVVLTQEIVKFVLSSGLFYWRTNPRERQQHAAEWSVKTWIAIAGIPAALYVVQNLASLLAYQNLEALTFNVLNQTKILSAALCCYLVMGKKQSRVQSFSLFLLLASALVIEKIVAFPSLFLPVASASAASSGLFSASLKTLSSLRSLKITRRVTHGVFPVLLASFISGLAGALTQKNLQGASKSADKKLKPRDAYLFSMEMNVASLVVLLGSLMVSKDGKRIAQHGFFDHWTPYAMIPILTNSVGGILVGLVTKYAGSVRKGFALIFGLLLSGLIQAGSEGISSAQIAGGMIAAFSLWLHTTHPYKPRVQN